MPERLPPHSHCLSCELPIGEEETFCSENCRAVHEDKEKREKRRMMLFYLMAIIAIVGISIVGAFV